MSSNTEEAKMVDQVKRRLESVIRDAFTSYVADCRKKIKAQDEAESVSNDVRVVAHLLQKRKKIKSPNPERRS